MLKGYRGFTREFARTGSMRALWMQLRTGAAHVARRAFGREEHGDPIERFLANYAADGFRLPDAESAALALAAEACLVCGLCSAECARSGGEPRVDPRDAVIAASRMAIDWVRLSLTPFAGEPDGRASETPCGACRACETVCPVRIPIHRVQEWLAAPRS
jgi:succinate dehydrogenase/fumarate reductase-like Fe-S protein